MAAIELGSRASSSIKRHISERAVVRARFKGVVAKVFHHDSDLVNASGADRCCASSSHESRSDVSVPIDQAAQVRPDNGGIVSLNGMEPGVVLARRRLPIPSAVRKCGSASQCRRRCRSIRRFKARCCSLASGVITIRRRDSQSADGSGSCSSPRRRPRSQARLRTGLVVRIVPDHHRPRAGRQSRKVGGEVNGGCGAR